MEAVGAGASLLTFLTVAFSVTKSIHDALSAIKDGPQVIRYLNDDFAQLESILQRLSQASFVSIGVADKSELEGLAKKCKDDLVDFEAKLRLLDVSGADGRRNRLWRKLKLCFTEKDLDQMRHVVQGHVQLLTIRLNLIQIQQGSFTATQSTDILSLLQQLRQDVAALKITDSPAHILQATSSDTTSRVTEVNDAETVPSPDAALDESIARLMRLLEKKPCVVESGQAEELVDDLEQLLQSVQKNVAIAGPAPEMEEDFQLENQNVSKELKLITSMVLSAPSMRINQNGPVGLLKAISQDIKISQDRKRNTLEMSDGVVTIATTKRRRKLVSRSHDDTNSGKYGGEFLANLTFKSKSMNKMLTLSVHQGQMLCDSFTSILPRITVCNIVPDNSPVFQIAASGSVEDLMKLISEGKASIHDHDTNGWSLLHHSVGHLPMLKFLVEQGLDVNEIAGHSHHAEIQTTPLHSAISSRAYIGHLEVLLHAGADPTVEIVGWRSAVEVLAYSNYVLEGFLPRLINISPFVYPDPKTSENQALISMICRAYGIGPPWTLRQTIQEVEYLLQQGYSINSINNKGFNALHEIFKRGDFCKEDMLDARNWLTYLVDQGADVYATDNNDFSVSHYAYGSKCEACFYYNSSFWGDIWDAVLDRCGYNILDFRKFCPRDARYVNGYTRKDFESLWRGREHRCPYWDDIPWPNSEHDIAPHDAFFARGQLCYRCSECQIGDDLPCYDCGVCLSVYEYRCVEGADHQHHDGCPRSRVAIWMDRSEGCSNYYELEEWNSSESDYWTSSSDETDSGDEEQFSDDEEPSDDEETNNEALPSDETSSSDESGSRQNRLVDVVSEGSNHDMEEVFPEYQLGHTFDEAHSDSSQEDVESAMEQGGHYRNSFHPQEELYENPWE